MPKLERMIVDTVNENNLPPKNKPNKKLRTTEKVYIASVDDKKNVDDVSKIKSVSDFAVMNGVYQEWTIRRRHGMRVGEYYLRTGIGSKETFSCTTINDYGSVDKVYGFNSRYGIAPMINLDLGAVLRAQQQGDVLAVEEIKVDDQTKHIIKLGEYPQSRVGEHLRAVLEDLYNSGNLKDGLIATGQWFSSNGNKHTDELLQKQNPVFEYEGKKYVRVVTNIKQRSSMARYSDHAWAYDERVEWVEVEPISFEITNWKMLPKSINPKGKGKAKTIQLESMDIVLGGMPFYPHDDVPQHSNMWQNSLIRAFLNSSNNETLGVNAEYTLNDEWDFSNSGFLYQAFSLDREPITEYTIPKHETSICEHAFEGCVALTKVTVPKHVKNVSKNAFDGCGFEYVYIDRDSGAFVLTETMPDNLSECINLTNLQKLNEAITFKNYNALLNEENLRKFRDLSIVLDRGNLTITEEVAMALVSSQYFDEFVEGCDFRFFKNELRNELETLGSGQYNEAEETGFYKFATLLGCFSNGKIKDKHGKDTEVIMAQKASSVMAQLLRTKKLRIESLDDLLKDVPLAYQPSQEFLKFIGFQAEKGKFTNLELLLNLEHGYPGLFAKTITQFDKLKGFRTTLSSKGVPVTVPWDDALINFYKNTTYYGVTAENQDIADVFASRGIDQEVFVEAVTLREGAKTQGVPNHLLGEELKENTILESIEEIKNRTGLALAESQAMIDSLFEKKFTFEMLDKYDPRNAIMGLYTSCCGTITGDLYGANIARASIAERDVQNLVIKNYNGEIVAKGTMYLDRKHGYVVINDFELSAIYKTHEEGIGFYDVKRDSAEEHERDMIFSAFMRGIYAFVEKYDEQNPTNPIKFVNVGLGHNRLQEQCKAFEDATKILTVPYDYDFCDAAHQQKVLYDRERHLKKLQEQSEKRRTKAGGVEK